jgi:hypothetical protein
VTTVVVRLSLDFYGKMVFASCVVFTSDLSFSLVSFVRKEVSSLLFFPSVSYILLLCRFSCRDFFPVCNQALLSSTHGFFPLTPSFHVHMRRCT